MTTANDLDPGAALTAALESVVHERRHSHVLQSPLAHGVGREGVMLHYDDSSRDDWAVEWFMDRRCTNGYTWLVLDDGRVLELADPAMRTPHAGACRTAQANSRFYGISAATNGLVVATSAQLDAIIALTTALCRHHGWNDTASAIAGHDEQAIWTPGTTRAAGMSDERGRRLWGRVGRKVDPTGMRNDRVPIIDINHVRARVGSHLYEGDSR